MKIQVGAHFLLRSTEMLPVGIPDSEEDKVGPMASVTLFVWDRSSIALGACLDLEGNRVQVGPDQTLAGPQVFGIATWRLMAQAEFRWPHDGAHRLTNTQPYAVLGLGWNINTVGAKVEHLGGTPLSGSALDLYMENSPSVRVGVGLHQRVTAQGLFVNVEGGWKYNEGDYRMTFANRQDAVGEYNLSGLMLLIGITLPI